MRSIIKTTFVLLDALLATNASINAEIAPIDFTQLPVMDITPSVADDGGIDIDLQMGLAPEVNIRITKPGIPPTSITLGQAGTIHISGPIPPGVYMIEANEVMWIPIVDTEGNVTGHSAFFYNSVTKWIIIP